MFLFSMFFRKNYLKNNFPSIPTKKSNLVHFSNQNRPPKKLMMMRFRVRRGGKSSALISNFEIIIKTPRNLRRKFRRQFCARRLSRS